MDLQSELACRIGPLPQILNIFTVILYAERNFSAMATSKRNAELQAQYNAKKENLQAVYLLRAFLRILIMQLVEKLSDLESQYDEHTVVIQRSLSSILSSNV